MSGPMTETSFFGFRDVFKLFLQRFINNIFVADKKKSISISCNANSKK